MTKFISLIILVVLASCGSSDNNAALTKEIVKQKNADGSSFLLIDSLVTSFSTIDTIVTTRFLSFVSYLDSIGFNSDTSRLKKIHTKYSRSPKYNINNHFFYGSTPETSGLYFYFNDFSKNERYVQKWHLDTSALKSFKSIVWYFFSEPKPDRWGDKKWYTDGIIEEWKFKDSSSAQISAKSVGAIAGRLYLNTGAFVCYIDNYMYIITSGSMGNMYTLRKPVFKAFADRNKATITNVDKWY